MKKLTINLILIILLISSSLTFKNDNSIPDDLVTSKIVLVDRDFDNWKKTISGNPKGFDDYAQKIVFKNYQNQIIEIENTLSKYNINYQKITTKTESKINQFEYLLDYKSDCNGGPNDNDWWHLSGGFYFTNLKTKHEYDIFTNFSKQIKKGLKKQLKNKSK